MADQKKIRVIIPEEVYPIIPKIIQKYSIEEGEEDFDKKFDADKPLAEDILVILIKNFSQKILSEKDFISALEKDLNIRKQTAEQIAKEVAISIIPNVKIVPESQFENVGAAKKNIQDIEEIWEGETSEPEEEQPGVKKEKVTPKPDTYREPVE